MGAFTSDPNGYGDGYDTATGDGSNNGRTVEELGTAVENEMSMTYTLVYNNQGDTLPEDVVAALVNGGEPFETKGGEALTEWASNDAFTGACDKVDELAKDIVGRWEREDDADYDALLDEEWPGSDERTSAIDEMRARDDGSWFDQLVKGYGAVLLRVGIPAMSEDAGLSFSDIGELQFLDLLDFPYTERNVLSAGEVIGNASPESSVAMGYALIGADLEAVANLPADGKVDLVDPHIWLGNPFAGSGWCSDEAFTGTLTVDRSDLKTDKDAFGYSWGEVVGGTHASYYEGTVKAVPPVVPTSDESV